MAIVTRIVARWQVQRHSAMGIDSVMMTFLGSSVPSLSLLGGLASLLNFRNASYIHMLTDSRPKERIRITQMTVLRVKKNGGHNVRSRE